MEVIDEGGFGCIFRPPLDCENGKSTDEKMISKLQPEKYGKYEMKQIDRLKKICKKYIPDCGKYFITDIHMCKPKITPELLRQKKCYILEEMASSALSKKTKGKLKSTRKITKKSLEKQKLNLLNMPYMGINLHKYILNIDFHHNESFINLNNSIIELYTNAIRILNNNNFYHNDIKTANILVDENNNLRLIDFGLANNIAFIHKFIFNKPYVYILMTDYFLDQLILLKRQNEIITREMVEPILNKYLVLIKLKISDNYLYTQEILEFMFPKQYNMAFKNPGTENIHPVLYEHFVNLCLRFNSLEEWTEIYIHNLDIVSIAIMYPDILCAMGIQKVDNPKLNKAIIDFYRKYVLECYEKISQEMFIQDLNNLNMALL